MAEPEVWLRGPVSGIAPELQPVAHALLQAREDLERVVPTLTREQLWQRPGAAASAAYHVRHLGGALDRLLTYARGEALGPAQRDALKAEQTPTPEVDGAALLAEANRAIENALAQLRGTDPATLAEPRPIGRAALPSTVLGLLFHAGEHSTRHAGQLITTALVLRGTAEGA